MSNAVFPTMPGLGWSVIKKPRFHTEVFEAVDLSELRASFTSYPTYDFILTYEVLREAAAYQELQSLIGFFRQRQGSFDNFLYSDASDNAATAQNFGTGNGTTTAFQLIRTYGGFIEPVMNLNGNPSIYINGVLKTSGTDYTISSTGLVTFTVAPASGAALTWTGNFYYRCRFLKDENEFDNFMYQLWTLKKLEIRGSTGTKI